MFNAGVDELLRELPALGDLTPRAVRRLLTNAFVDVVQLRDLGVDPDDASQATEELRRLSTALELYMILVEQSDGDVTRAAAFVAAEALELARELDALQEDVESDRVGA